MADHLDHVADVVGREGKIKTRVRFGLINGAWGDMEGSVNTLIDDLLWPTPQVTHTISAVAKGDLLQTMPLDVDGRPLKGEFLRWRVPALGDHRRATKNVLNFLDTVITIYHSNVLLSNDLANANVKVRPGISVRRRGPGGTSSMNPPGPESPIETEPPPSRRGDHNFNHSLT